MSATRRKHKNRSGIIAAVVAGVLAIGLVVSPLRPVIFLQGIAWVEVADTGPEREKGLMNRLSMPPFQGMLFVFDQNCTPAFWMKNTQIPLSIAFLSEDKTIVDIQTMEPLRTDVHHRPPRPVRYALEMNAGWFQKRNIRAGDKVWFW